MRAWCFTDHDVPWNFEGRFTHRRAINVWPRPYQQPHPPVWGTGSSDVTSVRRAARSGYVFATFLQPYPQVRKLFDAYRSAYVDNGRPGGGGLAVMPLIYVGDTEAEAEAGARELAWYLAAKVEPQFRNPPGCVPVEFNVEALKGSTARAARSESVRGLKMENARELGTMIYGTPDQVIAQIRQQHERVGGFDHLLMMMQAGFLDHKRTVRNIELFAHEVYQAIRELPGPLARSLPQAAE